MVRFLARIEFNYCFKQLIRKKGSKLDNLAEKKMICCRYRRDIEIETAAKEQANERTNAELEMAHVRFEIAMHD